MISLGCAFLAFSLLASATYLNNDLLDIGSDRGHPRKRLRPFASATIAIPCGLFAALRLVASLRLAYCVSREFFSLSVAYLLLTSAYSWGPKGHAGLDLLTLAMLNAVRLLAGAVVGEVDVGLWLPAVSLFLFLSLALVKHCARLLTVAESGASKAAGGDNRVSDLAVLWPLGVGAALSSVVVFALCISVRETQQSYASPQLLWGVALDFICWLACLWIRTVRGEMHHDPVVFAMTDTTSRLRLLVMLGAALMAHSHVL